MNFVPLVKRTHAKSMKKNKLLLLSYLCCISVFSDEISSDDNVESVDADTIVNELKNESIESDLYESNDSTITLQGILFNDCNWVVWVNNSEIVQNQPYSLDGGIEIISVTPKYVKFIYDNEEFNLYVGQTYNFKTKQILNKKVTTID